MAPPAPTRVLRAPDGSASEAVLSLADEGPVVSVGIPRRQVAFGRRDRRRAGYDRAREIAERRGFEPVERAVGGRAVAFDGATTVAFARAEPVGRERTGIADRYDRLLGDVADGLAGLGVAVERGEPENSFCPGSHSLSGEDGKLAGVAQRVRADAAVAAGVLLVTAADDLTDALAAVYGALDVPFDPETVGSVAAADGPRDATRVRRRLEDALTGDGPVEVVDTAGDGAGDG
ncbi:lipoyl protein ligase domain-containing protein [Saliphagus infecundisoli]|uniref:Lipoate--protein ligase family protein n=1 Tax=Saliphagus infecundisoli TaxID=1849069 RepID=A0ABD5QBH0_9EURY|nr:lipoate--protein ligase family protein [Saliphagus infecundisoli]